MTVYRTRKEPLTDLTYTEGFDLGLRDATEGKPRRVTAPRTANGSAGRFGYSDGYTDGSQRAAGRPGGCTCGNHQEDYCPACGGLHTGECA